MSKRIHHMGMTIDKKEHEEFHQGAPELTPRQHDALMKRLGVTKEQDEEWHRTHLTLAEQRAQGLRQMDPAAVAAGFLAWCVKEGWAVQMKGQYFASRDGVRELRDRFEIQV